MIPEHTSVPRWPAVAPEVDPTGTAYLVVSVGEDGGAIARRWAAEISQAGKALWACHDDRCERAWAAALEARLEDTLVGTRLMVAGPEIDVLDVLRAARAAGAIDAELRAYVTSLEERRVQCPHCTAHTVAVVDAGEIVVCGGCGRTLAVHHHVSRLHGAYLGSHA